MPTGYTHKVQAGEITEFKDFAIYCARAFGALIHMRDDSMDAEIPDIIEPSTFYAKELDKATADLAALEAMDEETIRERTADANAKAEKYYHDEAERRHTERNRYDTMLDKVNAWTPPTPDHESLKRFMVEQLCTSIDHDCKYVPNRPIPKTPTEWLNSQREELKRSIERYTEENSKEIERARERTEWVKALREAL
jgi:hypothetical protein